MAEEGAKYPRGQQLELGAHGSQIRWLRVWIVSLALLASLGAVAGAFGYWQASKAADENCVRIHRIVAVGHQIIADPDASGRPGKTLRQYRDMGSISPDQYAQAIGRLNRQVAEWQSADCPMPKTL